MDAEGQILAYDIKWACYPYSDITRESKSKFESVQNGLTKEDIK